MAWHCQEALSLSFNDRSSWELSGTFVILLCAEEREWALGNVHVDIVQCLWKWTIDWLHLTSARLCECIQAWVNNLMLPCCYTSEMCIYNGHPFGCCACTLLIIGRLPNGRVYLGHVCPIADPRHFWVFQSPVLSTLRWHTGSTFLDHFLAHLVPRLIARCEVAS